MLDERRRIRHLLEVVEEQQRRAAAAQVLGDRALEWQIAALTDVERPRHGGRHQRGVGERREIHEGEAALEARREILRRLNREARLARPAWSRQRQQPHAAADNQLLDPRELSGSSEERGALRRKIVAAAPRASAWSQPARRAARAARQASCVSSASTSAAVGRSLSAFASIDISSRSRSGGMPGSSSRGLRTGLRRDGVQDAERRVRLEWVRAGRQLVEDHPEREHVAGARRDLSSRLLGRHVSRRAEHQVGIGARCRARW